MKGEKRRKKRKLKRKYRNRRIAFLVLVAVVFIAIATLFSALTATKELAITGTKTVPKTTIRQIAKTYLNKSYWSMDKKSLANRLEQLPYVKKAEIGLSFPHTLTINIEEERAMAQIYSGDGYLLVNENFRILEKTRSYDANLPKITGIPTSGVSIGQIALSSTGNEKKIEMILGLFASEIKKDINTLAILDQGMKISFSDGTNVYIRSFENSEYKVKQLEEIRKEMKLKEESYKEIYLDQGDHPVAVKPSSMDEEEIDAESENMEARRESATEKGKDKAEVNENTSKVDEREAKINKKMGEKKKDLRKVESN